MAMIVLGSPVGETGKNHERKSETRTRHTRQLQGYPGIPGYSAGYPFVGYQPAPPVIYQVFIGTPPYQQQQPQPQQCSCPQPTPPSTAETPSTDLFNKIGGTGEKNSTGPSKCVWSIVACCAPGSKNIRYSCFELLGCPGAFWGTNPCEEKVVMAAANTALKYYEDNGIEGSS